MLRSQHTSSPQHSHHFATLFFRYAQKHDEEFEPYFNKFAPLLCQMASKASTKPKHDILAIAAIKFLSAVVVKTSHKTVFAKILVAMVQKIAVPSMFLRESDIDNFKENPEEYIRRYVLSVWSKFIHECVSIVVYISTTEPDIAFLCMLMQGHWRLWHRHPTACSQRSHKGAPATIWSQGLSMLMAIAPSSRCGISE